MSRLKLLRGEVETVEDDGIRIGVKVVNTSQQARVLDLNNRGYDVQGQCALFKYIFEECLESASVDGDVIDLKDMGEKYNIADDSTYLVFQKITHMAMAAMGITIVVVPAEGEEVLNSDIAEEEVMDDGKK